MTGTPDSVVVGISGGVDSSVAAWCLLEKGHEVTGLFMKNWEEDDDESYCAAAVDLDYAEKACQLLDIPLRTVNFAHEYWEKVFTIFLAEYRAGRTPNPDVLCNREIKFREFLHHADRLGGARIATGHYARIGSNPTGLTLLKGRDPAKDQSYFLHTLGQYELGRTLFPLGEMTKTQVRRQAQVLGLPNATRKDSTGICFIGERRFKDFLARYLPACPGQIKTLDDRVVGEHDGLWYFTLGQRHGLDIGGPGKAWYVAAKEMENNVLRVVQGHEHPALMCTTAEVVDLHWIAQVAPDAPLRCSAKTRYRQTDQPCTVSRIDSDRIVVEFDDPQRAVTPGQSLVLYQDQILVGGGAISHTANG
ncbi:MAG: tRNA 2-thiouridine(34) synthase MnmA [Pseudomonadota bacterium]|nr:tRNA 2-thiouridine(34) synthase MnmA [Pseudomonadota bacterium]